MHFCTSSSCIIRITKTKGGTEMGTFMLKAGETFGIKAGMLGLDIDRQLEILNDFYQGKVEFDKDSFWDKEMGAKRDIICIKWVAEDIDDLKLPECEYIAAQVLFARDYKGDLRTLRLPRCLKRVNLYYLDLKVKYIEKLVIPPGTEYVDENVCTIEKENADGSVSGMKMRPECNVKPYID